MALGGAFEAIGLRAVIIDARQYLSDGKKINELNASIARTTEQVGASSTKASATAIAAINAQVRAEQLREKATLQSLATQKAQAAAIRAEQGRNLTGQFISKPQATQTIAFAATAQRDLKIALDAANKATATEIRLAKEAAAAETLAGNAVERRAVLEGRKANVVGSKAGATAAGAALVGGAVAAVISGSAIKAAADYQQALIKIDNLTDTTTEETNQLGAALIKLSTSIPVSAADLASAAYFTLSSGIKSTAEALDIVTLAAKGSVIGLGETATIAAFITKTINAYGDANIKASQIIDLLTATVKNGSGEASDYAQELGRVTGVAAQMGVGLDEVLAIVGQLSNTLGGTSEATTAMLGILTHLNRVSPQSAEAFAGFGLSIKEVKDRIQQVGLVQFLSELADFAKNDAQALGDVFQDRRAINGFAQAFGDMGAKVKANLEDIRHSGGITQQAFEKANQGVIAQAKIFKNQLTAALLGIGAAVLPDVTRVLKQLSQAFDENKQAISTGFVVGLKLVFDILSGVVITVSTVVKALTALAKALGPLGVGVAVAALIGPITQLGLAFAWALPGGPILIGLLAIAAAMAEINKGIKVPLIGAIGGQQNPDTGQRGQFGRENIQGNVRQQLQGVGTGEKILGAITPSFFQSDEWKAAEAAVKRLREAGITTVEQFDKLTAVQKENFGITGALTDKTKQNAEATKLTEINLQKKIVAEQKDAQAIAIQVEALKALEEAFKTSSDAAKVTKNPVADLNLFGIVSEELIAALRPVGTSLQDLASAAGQIQGLDAVASALARADSASFQYRSTLATFASILGQVEAGTRGAGAALRAMISGLAQSALDAAKSAASSLFSSPTREVADLNVQKAQLTAANIGKANISKATINGLNDQIKGIDKQIKAARDNEAAAKKAASQKKADDNKAAAAARKAANDAIKEANEARRRAADAIVDALKIANIQARNAYERFNDHLEELIDSNNQAASDLQKAFIKSNDDLQKQINARIGAGDTNGALALVDQQRTQADLYHNNAQAIQDNIDKIEREQKAAARVEAERQRQAELAEALAEAQRRQTDTTDRSSDADETNTETTDENTEATSSSTDALEAQKEKIQDQIDAEQEKSDATADQTKAIQDQIDKYTAETEVSKALVEASNQLLLTQDQQRQAALNFADKINFASGVIKDGATNLLDLVPGGKAAVEAFNLLNDIVRIETSDAFRNNFIPGVNDAAQAAKDYALILKGDGKPPDVKAAAKVISDAIAASITGQEQQMVYGLLTSTDNLFNSFSDKWDSGANTAASAAEGLGFHFNSAGVRITTSASSFATKLADLGKDLKKSFGDVGGFAVGGYTGNSGGIVHPNEWVIPGDSPSRARQIMATMPPGLMSAMNQGGGGGIFAPNITVNGGSSMDSMERAAIAAVQRAFRDARSSSIRSGGRISQGLSSAK